MWVGLGLYAALLTLLLLAYWVYCEAADRLHARRTARAFDAHVAMLNRVFYNEPDLRSTRGRGSKR